MNLDRIIELARKADACPYNSVAVSTYREAVATLQPDVLLAFVLAYQRYAFCRTAGAWESEVVLDTLSPEEFDARVDQEIAARAAEISAQKGPA